MPYKPKSFCAYPLCPNLAEECNSYCATYKKSIPKDSRQSSAKRGYDRHWQKLRVMHLRENPLCQMCRGVGVIKMAELVHHVKSVNDRPDLRLQTYNLISLCRDCHGITNLER